MDADIAELRTLIGMDDEHRERHFVRNSKMNWKPVKIGYRVEVK